MALSEKNASDRAMVAFSLWCDRNGYTILEMRPYTSVHRVHEKRSWHYDSFKYGTKIYSRAMDLNWKVVADEKKRIAAAVVVARSMGIAVIYALNGTNGPTRAHVNHGHFDQGSYSNLGQGRISTPKGSLLVWDLQAAVNTPSKIQDNLWGPTFDKRIEAVRWATPYKGPKFPSGVEYTQRVIGVDPDGDWGSKSKIANVKVVKEIQKVLKTYGFYDGEIDGDWGKKTDVAYLAARKKFKR